MKIEKCTCGNSADIIHSTYGYNRVMCKRIKGDGSKYPYRYNCCFIGPEYKSIAKAIQEWNKLMVKK